VEEVASASSGLGEEPKSLNWVMNQFKVANSSTPMITVNNDTDDKLQVGCANLVLPVARNNIDFTLYEADSHATRYKAAKRSE
jgi:hypothetical protein